MVSVDAPCYLVSNMSRRTRVVGQAPCYSCSKVATYCSRTVVLLFTQHETAYCCRASALLFLHQHEETYCSPHPPTTARQKRGRTSVTPDRKRGSLYVSLPHPPSMARQTRGRTSGTSEREHGARSVSCSPRYSFCSMRRLTVVVGGYTLLFVQQHESVCSCCRTGALLFL